MRSQIQLPTTTGLISRDAGEHCLDSLRARNERQRGEDIPLRREALQSSSPSGVLREIGFCGNSLGLIMGDMCWDGIGQRGTWHETDGGYLWILVVWTLDPVASATMLLTETCTL